MRTLIALFSALAVVSLAVSSNSFAASPNSSTKRITIVDCGFITNPTNTAKDASQWTSNASLGELVENLSSGIKLANQEIKNNSSITFQLAPYFASSNKNRPYAYFATVKNPNVLKVISEPKPVFSGSNLVFACAVLAGEETARACIETQTGGMVSPSLCGQQ